MKIPIKKHTPVRMARSFWYLDISNSLQDWTTHTDNLVTDISRVEKKEDLSYITVNGSKWFTSDAPLPYKHYKGDWNETLADMGTPWHQIPPKKILKPHKLGFIENILNKLKRGKNGK